MAEDAEHPSATAPARELRKREGEVVDAAVDVFWRKGFAAASVADVAEQVGMLKGSLYYYIDSKEDLLVKIFRQAYEEAVAIVAEVAALDAAPLERLRTYFERYLLWYLENVKQVSLYLNEWRNLTGERRTLVLEQRATFEAFVHDLIEAARAEGALSPDLDAHLATSFVLGAANSVSTWYDREGRLGADEVARRYADMIVGALVGSGRPARGAGLVRRLRAR